MGINPVLKEGDKAPEFALLDDRGETVRLSDYAGKRVVLYFYPKDNTPGCTTEACDFRDHKESFEEKGAEILGISPDKEASHVRFRDKFALNFRLLCDPDKEAAQAYGVWREKKNYGRVYMGIVRSTFVIDANGVLEKIYDNVRAKGHAERVLNAL